MYRFKCSSTTYSDHIQELQELIYVQQDINISKTMWRYKIFCLLVLVVSLVLKIYSLKFSNSLIFPWYFKVIFKFPDFSLQGFFFTIYTFDFSQKCRPCMTDILEQVIGAPVGKLHVQGCQLKSSLKCYQVGLANSVINHFDRSPESQIYRLIVIRAS